jgi:hypothetical protein
VCPGALNLPGLTLSGEAFEAWILLHFYGMSRRFGSHWTAALATAGAAAFSIACSSTPILPPYDGALPLGNWGSDSAGVIVSDTATHIHIKCTYGDISGRVPIGADGSFDVAGRYQLRAYPIEIGPTVPARFTGRVRGARVTITVTVNDTVQKQTVVLGPVSATYGIEARMWPCPICRRPIVTRSVSAVAGARLPTL